jgi:hypothetical protein
VLFHREFGGDTLGNADAIAILDDLALAPCQNPKAATPTKVSARGTPAIRPLVPVSSRPLA